MFVLLLLLLLVVVVVVVVVILMIMNILQILSNYLYLLFLKHSICFLPNQLIGSNQWQQVFLRNQLIGSNQWQVIVDILNFHRLCLGGMRKIYQLIFKVGNE